MFLNKTIQYKFIPFQIDIQVFLYICLGKGMVIEIFDIQFYYLIYCVKLTKIGTLQVNKVFLGKCMVKIFQLPSSHHILSY